MSLYKPKNENLKKNRKRKKQKQTNENQSFVGFQSNPAEPQIIQAWLRLCWIQFITRHTLQVLIENLEKLYILGNICKNE